eukprot:5586585-Prymnesium_polylepis.1
MSKAGTARGGAWGRLHNRAQPPMRVGQLHVRICEGSCACMATAFAVCRSSGRPLGGRGLGGNGESSPPPVGVDAGGGCL